MKTPIPLGGCAAFKLVRDLVSPHSPLGESRPEGPERGHSPDAARRFRMGTLPNEPECVSIRFGVEPWANAQRLIRSVADLARVVAELTRVW